jgi:hypothetical protein
MANLFKRRGSIGALARNHERESQLLARIEERIDAGDEPCGLIEAIIAECRVRTVSLPDDASWRLYLGRFLMAAGDPVEARYELEQAALLDPRDPRIQVHLALWYEAALLAACGDRTNIDLPGLAGPWLSADATRFAEIDEPLTIPTLAACASELFEAALRFKLPHEDVRFLEHHIDVLRAHRGGEAMPTSAPAPANVTFMTRTG